MDSPFHINTGTAKVMHSTLSHGNNCKWRKPSLPNATALLPPQGEQQLFEIMPIILPHRLLLNIPIFCCIQFMIKKNEGTLFIYL